MKFRHYRSSPLICVARNVIVKRHCQSCTTLKRTYVFCSPVLVLRRPTLARWTGSVSPSSTRDGVPEGSFKRRWIFLQSFAVGDAWTSVLLVADLLVLLLQIKVRGRKKEADDDDDEEEEPGAADAVICEECGRSDRRHRLLVCRYCDSGCGTLSSSCSLLWKMCYLHLQKSKMYLMVKPVVVLPVCRFHMDCLTPSLNSGPEGDWTCPDCAVSPHTGRAMSSLLFYFTNFGGQICFVSRI